MTTIVHTADLHLRADDRDRLDGLEAVIETARSHDAEVVTIGGDLFDRTDDVDELRPTLRNHYFTDQPFEILLIPGNHDVEAFRDDLFFGDCCTVFAESEHFEMWRNADESISIVAIPYQEAFTDDLVSALDARSTTAETEILLFHGSLDAPIGDNHGDETDYRYFPVTEGELERLEFDYYLAGHYHDAYYRQFANGAEFAYPGTPVSTRTSETGRRQAVVLDPGNPLRFEALATPHVLEHQVMVAPGEEESTVSGIDSWVTENVTEEAIPRISVDGVVEIPEDRFVEELHCVAEADWIDHQWVSVDHIRNHPVIMDFENRLREQSWESDTERAVWLRTLQVASRVASSGTRWR